MEIKMTYRILFFLLFSVNFYAQESVDSTNLPMSDQLSDVEIFSTLIKTDNSVSLSRKQFLTLAGALEDPTRLLIKFPGISTINDQANSVVYHGMPAQYHKWSLYGARMLNPNHLGNAGTISDFPSRSAGGVNMFSGQAIGKLEFNGNPSDKSLDALSANSDITLRDPYQNTVSTNFSLIGLEAGIDRINEEAKSSLLLNYRYSTVGLLTTLGLDFGGEIINYQDITGKYSKTLSNGDKFSTYFSLGYDSNTKEPIPLGDQPEEYKDLQEIDYFSLNIVGGLVYNKDRENFKFHNTLNVSFNSTGRTSATPAIMITRETNSEYDSDEVLIASKHEYSILGEKLNVGFTFEPYLHLISLEKKYPALFQEFLDVDELERTALHLIPSIFSNYKLSEYFSLSGRLGVQSVISNQTILDVVGQGELKYSNSNFVSSLRISRASQVFQPEILIYSVEPDFTSSNNVELSAWYKGIGISGFMHNVSNVPISTSSYGFSAFENLDNLPISIYPYSVIIEAQGEVDIYGVSIAVIKDIGGFNVSSNLTLTDSKHYGVIETTKAPLDYGHIFNLSLTKNWKIGAQKEFGISASFHHRGGARQNPVDLDRSFAGGFTNYSYSNQYAIRLENYYRADLRIIYKPSKRSTISLDIQNVTNRENDAFYYYEGYTRESTLQKQLGMIPILGWRVEW